MHDITVKKGRPITYDICFGGEPAPKIVWLRNSKTLTTSYQDELKIEQTARSNGVYSQINATLSIAKSQRERDMGLYAIRLENATGTVEATGFVNVLDVPGAPREFAVKSISPDRIAFSWSPPQDDGGQPIKLYQIRMMDFDTGDWYIVGDVRLEFADEKVAGDDDDVFLSHIFDSVHRP